MRFTIKALSTAVVLTIAASAAQAQEITFTGNASGTFSNPSTSLTYQGSTFNNTTLNGFAGFGSAPSMTSNFNNFGSLSLSNSNFTPSGVLNLLLTFTAPQGIQPGGQAQTFTANLTGSVNTNGQGGIFVNFGNPAQRTFTFATPTPGGSFTLTVNNVSIDAPSATQGTNMVAITGNITGSVVPEPSTYALMGTGLAGLVGMARRRRAVA